MPDFRLNVQVDDLGVATVEFERGRRNYFTVELVQALVRSIEQLAESSSTRAVVLQSSGRHFCAGAEFGSPDSPIDDVEALYGAAVRIVEQPLPIVAAVQGAAIGGGLGLALVADFRVAEPTTRLAANFARLGIHHGFGSTATLPAVVGNQNALDLLYTGRTINADEAFAMGLCDRIAEQGRGSEVAHELARELARSAPLALRAIRRTMRADLAGAMRSAVVNERAEQVKLFGTSDFAEGIVAAGESRVPVFLGR